MKKAHHSREEIETRVDELLREHSIENLPVRVELIARSAGLPLVEKAMDADVSGALVSAGGQFGIAVNATHAPVRKRFTIAHELGHYLLEHEPGDHLDWEFTVIRRDGRSSEANDRQEIEANFFAASLLMPRHFLRADVERKCRFNGEVQLDEGEIAVLAKKYGVSKTAMHYRLVNLGFVSMASDPGR
jgi:Zn-dependent peptidase ImmA (M78 family)